MTQTLFKLCCWHNPATHNQSFVSIHLQNWESWSKHETDSTGNDKNNNNNKKIKSVRNVTGIFFNDKNIAQHFLGWNVDTSFFFVNNLEKCLMKKIKIGWFFFIVKWKYCILWGAMCCSPDQLHLFLPVVPRTCCWLWAEGRAEKSQRGENNQNPKGIKQNKTLQASGEGAVYSHHPKLSMEQLAFHLQQVASSPHACTERHSKWQEPKKRKVSGFKFSFYWRKEKKKEKNRLFCLFFFFFVCFQVDVIHVVSLSQCPKATSLFTIISRYSGRSVFPFFFSSCLPGRGSLE